MWFYDPHLDVGVPFLFERYFAYPIIYPRNSTAEKCGRSRRCCIGQGLRAYPQRLGV
jgi:hypothetical protein